MAGYPLKKDTAALPLVFTMYDSAQARPVGKTGLTPTVVISKNGASFAPPEGTIEEIGNGKYKVNGHVDDTDTLGPLELYATAAGADPTWETYFVVSYNPLDADGLGLSRIDAAVSSRLATDGYTAPDNASAAAAAASAATVEGRLTGTRAGLLDNLSRLDAAITSLPSAANVAVSVWNYLTSNGTVTGSMLEYLNSLVNGATSRPLLRSFFSNLITTDRMTTLTDLGTMIESDSTPDAKFTVAALENAPTGSGGGPGALADADIDWSFSARPTTGGAFILQALSVEYLKASATAFVGERQIDPTSYAVEFAFVTSSSALGAATWHECEWDENGLARLLMGPGEVALTAGAYYWYVRVTSSPETSLQRLDPILRVE